MNKNEPERIRPETLEVGDLISLPLQMYSGAVRAVHYNEDGFTVVNMYDGMDFVFRPSEEDEELDVFRTGHEDPKVLEANAISAMLGNPVPRN